MDRVVLELRAEIKLPFDQGGTGNAFSLDLSYDSGCSSMAIPRSDMTPDMLRVPLASLQPVRTRTASGRFLAHQVTMDVRVLDRNCCQGAYLVTFCPV